MAVSESNQLKALINMNGSGTIGAFPDPGTLDPTPTNRHLLGGFPFEDADVEVPFILVNDYFKAPTDEIMATSAASELPDGKAWRAKVLTNKFMYAMVFAWAGCFNMIRRLIETVAREMNINTTNALITDWEESVGLPDSRFELSDPTLVIRRENVISRLAKKATVTLEEMQDMLDEKIPDSGIWLTTGQDWGGFPYTFPYTLGPTFGARDRWVIFVNYPEFASNIISFKNLESLLREFSNAGVLFIQNIIDEDQSYVVITTPQSNQTIYSVPVEGGGFESTVVKWKQIDKLNTVLNVIDSELILPATTSITRSFTDSDLVSISKTITPTIKEL